jgi:hypothetical protein
MLIGRGKMVRNLGFLVAFEKRGFNRTDVQERSHRSREESDARRDRREAGGLDIAVECIPSGMTDEWSPLDLRIFGSLKQRARAMFDDQWAREDGVELTQETAIALLLKAWDSITQEEILNARDKLRSV